MEITDNILNYARELLARYKENISNTGHAASGELQESATVACEFNGKYFEVSFFLQPYWKYLENGTRPHFPPISAIEKWIEVKPIIPMGYGGGRVPNVRQLAYLISREIAENGTPATKILQKTIDEADDLIDLICDELIKQLEKEAADVAEL